MMMMVLVVILVGMMTSYCNSYYTTIISRLTLLPNTPQGYRGDDGGGGGDGACGDDGVFRFQPRFELKRSKAEPRSVGRDI